MQMPGSRSRRIVVISGGGSAASVPPPPRLAAPSPPRPAAHAQATLVTKRRRLCVVAMGSLPSSFRNSDLQLAFEFVEKTPVRMLGDDCLRDGLGEARLIQPKCVPAHRVFGVIVPPCPVE